MARSFNGTSDRIVVDGAAIYRTSVNFSISAWLNASGTALNDWYAEGNSGDVTPFIQCSFNGAGKVNFSGRRGGNNLTSDINSVTSVATVGDTTWHHVVFAQDGVNGKWQIYVDGKQDNSGTYTVNAGGAVTNTAQIGAIRRTTITNFYGGKAAHLATWNRVLSAGEIAALYAGTKDPRQLRAYHYWPLHGGTQEPDWGVQGPTSRSSKPTAGLLVGTTYYANEPARPRFFMPTWVRGALRAALRATRGVQAVIPAAINATSAVTATVTRRRPVEPAAINATSSMSGTVAGLKHVTPAAIAATSTVTANVTGRKNVRPAAISATSFVHPIFGPFTDATGVGPGNGGERFPVRLAPNGTTQTATLAASVTATATLLELTGDGGFPDASFVVTVDDEVLYVAKIAPGSYRIRQRRMSNTSAAPHLAGASCVWGDSYDFPIVAAEHTADSFVADITGSGSTSYPGWLMAYDSSQAYLAGARYPTRVASLLGVFDAGAGSTGTNRLYGAQPTAGGTAAAVSDDCPVGVNKPARVSSSIAPGDVALLRYTNPAASALDLGPRSPGLQALYGIKAVDAANTDVTFTDPDGTTVDAATSAEWDSPLGPGINPDSGMAVPNVHYTSTTLPGTARTKTHGGTPSPPNFPDKGYPFAIIAVRQGNRRIPHWRAYDYADFGYTYCGFDTDATFVQFLLNLNGLVPGTVPIVNLPGPQDIDGPDAVWDEADGYRFAAVVGVVIWAGPYLVLGPRFGGGGGTGSSSGGTSVPTVSFPAGPATPVVTPPAVVIGGDGGDIPAPTARKQLAVAQLI